MSRLKRLEARLEALEKLLDQPIKVTSTTREHQLLSAIQSGAAVLIKDGPSAGELDLKTGKLTLR